MNYKNSVIFIKNILIKRNDYGYKVLTFAAQSEGKMFTFTNYQKNN